MKAKIIFGSPVLVLVLAMGLVVQSNAGDQAYDRADQEPGEGIGIREIKVASPARGRDLDVTVWYPASASGQVVLAGADRIFEGTEAYADAPVRPGAYPLIVFSHGSGASIHKMSWLATRLAEKGFIVAGPNHPGTTSGDSTPEDTPKLWQRTDDLSNVISALLSEAPWRSAIAADKIGVLGFSLGGAAALELAGARADLDAYIRYCDTYPDMADCVWFAGGRGYRNREAIDVDKFDLRSVDKERFEQSNLDPRIRAAVLVDPSLALAFDEASVANIRSALHFINLGDPDTVPISVKADGLAGRAPDVTHSWIMDAVHFSFMPTCADGAAAFMRSIGEPDALCTDGGLRSRADIHAELERDIAEAFERMLGPRD
ncbi:alpha/beta hydrolase family protein [Roseibium marinum]|uniref:Putative dienelactone hydrolase n=1 Tax=Roseibium marinum TaxID=281252 RepID=A0A2S3UKY3_9HYPH|nr:alpha/beta fold hydrolase [Roseibium marinum]POF28367.1 putative dienelactone hydrolase [Roseibium marinum]